MFKLGHLTLCDDTGPFPSSVPASTHLSIRWVIQTTRPRGVTAESHRIAAWGVPSCSSGNHEDEERGMKWDAHGEWRSKAWSKGARSWWEAGVGTSPGKREGDTGVSMVYLEPSTRGTDGGRGAVIHPLGALKSSQEWPYTQGHNYKTVCEIKRDPENYQSIEGSLMGIRRTVKGSSLEELNPSSQTSTDEPDDGGGDRAVCK